MPVEATMLSTAYYRTPTAHQIHPASPNRKTLTDLTPAQRRQAHNDHRAAWMAHRAHGIGASEASTILGVNPYASLTRLYAEKTRGYAEIGRASCRERE